MMLLAENGDYKLFKTKAYVSCNYIVFKRLQHFKQEVARSKFLVQSVTKFFTEAQIKLARKMLLTSKKAGLC